MLRKFLQLLFCPYCGSDFELEALAEENGEIITGCLKCECSEFPIISGILILKDSPLNKDIIKLIKERKSEEAIAQYLCCENFEKINSLETTLDLPFPLSLKLRWMEKQIILTLARAEEKKKCRKIYKNYSDKGISFHELLGTTFYETYLKHRFSGETLWSLYPFIPLIKNKNERILDLCCGVGYTSFILSNYVEPQQLCCADLVFSRLYLAKKYFAPNAQFVCLNADYPLPFKNKSFASILMLDAFNYIRTRALLAREVERLLLTDGLVLLLHIHNSYGFNLGGGTAISPKALVNLFKNSYLKTKVIPERNVLTNFVFGDKLDIGKEFSEEELNSSNALILMATLDKSIFKTYNKVNSDFLSIRSHLIINPIYEMKRKDSKFLLKRPLHKYALGDIYPFSEKYLPKEIELSENLLTGREVKSKYIEKVDELMKQFVVVNVPPNYI